MNKRGCLSERVWQGCLAPALFAVVLFLLLCVISCTKIDGRGEETLIPVRFVVEGLCKSADETFLQDVNVFVVNEVGGVVSHGYFTSSAEAAVTIYKGLRYKVFAVANLGYSAPLASESDILGMKGGAGTASGTAVATMSDADSGSATATATATTATTATTTTTTATTTATATTTTATTTTATTTTTTTATTTTTTTTTTATATGTAFTTATASASGYFLMSGSLPLQQLSGKGDIVVPLTRAVSKITLKADYSGLDDGVSITVDNVSLCNIPKEVVLFGENRVVSADGAVEGESRDGLNREELQMGISFYQFENLQGDLLVGNVSQKEKVWPQGSLYASTCSYVEMKGRYISPVKEGEIVYRFYLGNDMLSNFDVKRNTHYILTVNFSGDGSIDENSWRVDVSGLEDVFPPSIVFERSSSVMYDLEESTLGFQTLDTRGKELVVASSDPSVVKVLDYGDWGVKVQGVAPGNAKILANVGDVAAECNIVVEKLRIVPAQDELILYDHFYEDIAYTIYPPHAAFLGVNVTSSSANIVTGYGGVSARVIPQYSGAGNLPAEEELTMGINGRSDVTASVSVVVNPVLLVPGSIVANANMGSQAAVKSLGIQAAPQAQLKYSWLPSDGISCNGDPGDNIVVSIEENKITFPIPNAANGVYRLKVSVVGDDGYGSDEVSHTDAVKFCDITVYETVYLVGISKSHNRTKVDVDPDKWMYENEIVAKWLSHPNSLLFPEGELSLDLNFLYNGVEYDASHTEFVEDFTFEFENGEQIPIDLGESTLTYKGVAPQSYFAYFYLQPATSPYVAGNIADGTPYLYIYSRNFASGFSQKSAPNWKNIFEYVYP